MLANECTSRKNRGVVREVLAQQFIWHYVGKMLSFKI